MSDAPTERQLAGRVLLCIALGIFAIAIIGSWWSNRGTTNAVSTANSKALQTEAAATSAPVPVTLPDVPLPVFRVTYQDNSIVTIVVRPSTSDTELERLIWELRVAVRSRSLNALKISQSLIDERDPGVWFEIYKGDQCASENHVKGRPPCGLKEHEAATYLFGTFANRNDDSATIYHGEAETDAEQLWGAGHPAPASFVELLQASQAIEGEKEPSRDAKTELLTTFSTSVWAGGRKAEFIVGSDPNQVSVIADWLVSTDNQRLLRMGIESRAIEACEAGFRKVRMMPFQGDKGTIFNLKCR